MYKKQELDNGLNVIASPMPGMNSISLGIWIGVGGRYESARQSGISHFVEHMLFKGTFKRDTRALKEAVEGVGGSLNGFTADEATCYMVKVPAEHFELGMDVLTDMVFNARFDKSDIEKEKYVVSEEIKMYRDQPSEHVMELLEEIMWPGNALGRPLTGNITTVKGFKRDELVKFRDEHYFPGNMSVIAAGKIRPASIIKYASMNLKGRCGKRGRIISPKVSQKQAHTRFSKGDTSQAHLAIGFHADAENMRERFAMKLLSVILGGNMSSRLFEELREKHGLCYDIGSTYKRHKDVGEFVIHAGVDNKKALRSAMAIMDELRKIRDIGVTDDEILRAREFAKGQFQLALENTMARMMWFGDNLIVDGKVPSPDSVLKEVDRISGRDIQNAALKIFKHHSTNMAVVGKLGAKDRAQMKKVVDTL